MRDPRDVLISSGLYQESHTTFLSGMNDVRDQNELIHYIAFGFINVYENYLADKTKTDTMCILYEDLVCSVKQTVAMLESRLQLRLDIDESRRSWAEHATARTLEGSVRRWDRERLHIDTRRKLVHCVGSEMADLGYDVSGMPMADYQALVFSRARMPALPAVGSEDGVMTIDENCARIEISGSDFWFALPLAGFDARQVDHVWVCLTGGAGNHCSIYWRRKGENFSQERSFHVEYRANNCWRVLDFPVHRHSLWSGAIEELRLDVFNRADEGFGKKLSAAPECRGTGMLRWVRLLSVASQDSVGAAT
jgi:hypothetical protein